MMILGYFDRLFNGIFIKRFFYYEKDRFNSFEFYGTW